MWLSMLFSVNVPIFIPHVVVGADSAVRLVMLI